MRGYALASMVPDAQLTPAIAQAILMSLRRFEAHWRDRLVTIAEWGNAENVALEASYEVGAVPADPTLALIQIVQSSPVPSGDIADHTVDANGRPICYISWDAVQAEGGTLTGPDGLVSAITHEVHESRLDPLCLTVTPLPNVNGMGDTSTPLESDDALQGTDYCEPAAPGIYVSNSCTPAYFLQGNTSETAQLDTRADVTTSAVSEAFEIAPEGYREVIASDGTTSNVYGAKVSHLKHARLERTGPRSGAVRAARRAV